MKSISLYKHFYSNGAMKIAKNNCNTFKDLIHGARWQQEARLLCWKNSDQKGTWGHCSLKKSYQI